MGRTKYRIKVQLKERLREIGVTPYTLGKWAEGVSLQTIYAVASGTRRPSLEVLEAILEGLNAGGHETRLEDILRVETIQMNEERS